MGSAGAREISALLSDSSASVRRAAIYSLGQLGRCADVADGSASKVDMSTAVRGVRAVLETAVEKDVRQTALHALALMGETGACEVAAATAGSGAAARDLRFDAEGDGVIAEARRLPAARRHAEEKLKRIWRKPERPG